MEEREIVEVYVARDNIEAQFLRGLLEDSGIEVRVVGEGLHGLTGGLPSGYSTAPRLWVRRKDAERARKVIAEYEASSS